MKENLDWQLTYWGIKERLVVATIYGCKNLGPWKQRQRDLKGKIVEAITKVLGKGKEWLIVETSKHPNTGTRGKPLQEVLAMVILPEGNNEPLLLPQNRVTYVSINTAVIFLEFPWEIPARQHFLLSMVPPHLTGEQVIHHLQERLKDRLERDPEIEKISEIRNGRPEEHWNLKLHFWQSLDEGDIKTLEDPELIMDTLKWDKKVWEADGVRWRISHG